MSKNFKKEKTCQLESNEGTNKAQTIKDQAWEKSTIEILRRQKKRAKKEAKLAKRKDELMQLLKKGSKNTGSGSKPLPKVHLTCSLAENLNKLKLGDEISKTIDEALALLSDDDIAGKLSLKSRGNGQTAYEEKRLKELKVSHPELKLSEIKTIISREWKRMHSIIDEKARTRRSIYQFF
ncbi:coiled-coil domain-containing protein 124-B-like [Anthonomus grandis grandis]|uniref:coiled-coil domain-containing protein 124-B-like n=1 Tax=Anthonomus grandis grandis TaxID=2921223 RepID=UPI002164F49C|nr:coiled-coil domain-containing protein 124-B-like [Anthonomus grandis grandis]